MARSFADESARYIRDVYLPRLTTALQELPSKDLWWQPHAECISFGIILKHLEGNVRQWILCALGSELDRRDRNSEFQSTSTSDGKRLLSALNATVAQAAVVLESIGHSQLDQTLHIQGQDMTVKEAIYHVVEHFSWHTGQAVWIAKARAGTGHGVAFYDDAKLQRSTEASEDQRLQ